METQPSNGAAAHGAMPYIRSETVDALRTEIARLDTDIAEYERMAAEIQDSLAQAREARAACHRLLSPDRSSVAGVSRSRPTMLASKRDVIVQVLRDARRPMTRKEITVALKERYVPIRPDYVSNSLLALCETGVLRRVGERRGRIGAGYELGPGALPHSRG